MEPWIFIPTYGRANNQITWRNLPKEIQEQTILVVQNREWKLYKEYPVIILPNRIETLEPTRQYILDCLVPDEPFCMLDDDLVFATRRDDEPDKFEASDSTDIEMLFNEIRINCDKFAHVGVSGREGANRNTERILWNSRVMRILAYDARVLRKEQIRFDRLPLMIDFDVTLQLLKLGYECPIANWIVHNQPGSNTEGGCSHYRTPEKQREAAETLARLHPDVVTVVQKKTKTSWGGEERYDVRIQWKRAFEIGQQRAVPVLGQ
jgi:hypothetical protein